MNFTLKSSGEKFWTLPIDTFNVLKELLVAFGGKWGKVEVTNHPITASQSSVHQPLIIFGTDPIHRDFISLLTLSD
jgi:hypothetical protein